MTRSPGPSVRLKLTLSYAGFLLLGLAGVMVLAAVWLFLLRGVPGGGILTPPLSSAPYRSLRLRDFAPAAAVALTFLVAFALAGGWILARHMLAPLTRITDATREAANGSLSHRIDLPGRQDEFRELADAFDAMLARLEVHVAEQGRFAANASHELRTPLATTQALLDAAALDPGHDTGRLLVRLRAVNTRAIDLTESLLLLSRADQRSFPREPVDLSLLAEEAVETLLPLAEKRGVTIEVSGDVTVTVGSPALLLQLTTNLVHNAIVHNHCEGGSVWVSAAAGPGSATLTVENTGDQLTPGTVATFPEPFQRGTARLHTDQAGVGLGLAIVQSITRAHGGSLTLTPRPAGGLCAVVRLPDDPGHPRG